MGESTEIVKLQRAKWAVLSTVVQAQVVVIGAALIAAAESGTTAGWINACVAIIGAIFAVVGRFAAEGGLSWKRPPAEQPAAMVVDTSARLSRSDTPPKG